MHTASELMSLNRIVTVSRDPDVQRLAQKCGQEVFGADDPIDALEIIQTVDPNLILFDHRFSADYIREFIDTTDKKSIDIPVVVVGDSNYCENEFYTEFTQLGIYDYIQGIHDYDRLQEIINRIKNENDGDVCNKRDISEKENHFFVNELAVAVSIVGKSRSIINTLKMTEIIASSQCNPILILGETGTGKELAAKAICSQTSKRAICSC